MLREDQFFERRKQASLTILNRLEESKLSAFAKRAVSSLKDFDSAFTPDQVDFLAKTSELVASEIREAELALRVFFLRAVRLQLDLGQFEDHLRSENLEGKRVEILLSIWSKTKHDLEAYFSQPSVLASSSLPAVVSIESRLLLAAATSRQRSVAHPVAALDFHLAENQHSERNFVAELDHAGLSQFHKSLEEIQTALDNLTS